MSGPGGKIIFVPTEGLVSRQGGIPRAEEAAPSIPTLQPAGAQFLPGTPLNDPMGSFS